MSVIGSNVLAGASGQADGVSQIERSLRFNSADSASLSLASYSGSGTFSCWVKRCKLGSAQTIITNVAFAADDTLNSSTAVFRDPSAWMHIVVSSGGTYVNGSSIGSGSAVTPSAIGSGCDLYLAEVYFIDGQALAASDFGKYDSDNVWQPKAYGGTYGTNGFHLDFSDNTSTTTVAEDSSGNNNHWTANNLSVTAGAGNDSLIDSPTNYEAGSGNNGGNYATLNPLIPDTPTLSNGNLGLTTGSRYESAFSGFGLTSGKWYFEGTVDVFDNDAMIGVESSTTIDATQFVGKVSDSLGYAGAFGRYWEDGTQSSNWGDSFTAGDTISCAFDADSGKIWFAKNGTWQASGDPAAGTNPASTLTTGLEYLPGFSGGTNGEWTVNFGQRPFAYTPPTGFVSLCTENLTDTTVITSGSYTGNSDADGPFVFINGVPTSMTIGGSAVTFGTGIDRLCNGFKIRSATTNNTSGTS